MIKGKVSPDGIPFIEVRIKDQTLNAIIDTGFNGDLELPESLHEKLNHRFVGSIVSMLAAGQRIEEYVYLVDFPFDDKIVQAEVTFVPDTQILIGTHLLQNYLLKIDFVNTDIQLSRQEEIIS